MKTLLHRHLATFALAVELTTLGAVVVFMIAATVGLPATAAA
jgi:hypothetical protein